MMKKIKYGLAVLALAAIMSSCTLYEDKWSECQPLPDVDENINPDPWEPPIDDGGELGD